MLLFHLPQLFLSHLVLHKPFIVGFLLCCQFFLHFSKLLLRYQPVGDQLLLKLGFLECFLCFVFLPGLFFQTDEVGLLLFVLFFSPPAFFYDLFHFGGYLFFLQLVLGQSVFHFFVFEVGDDGCIRLGVLLSCSFFTFFMDFSCSCTSAISLSRKETIFSISLSLRN